MHTELPCCQFVRTQTQAKNATLPMRPGPCELLDAQPNSIRACGPPLTSPTISLYVQCYKRPNWRVRYDSMPAAWCVQNAQAISINVFTYCHAARCTMGAIDIVCHRITVPSWHAPYNGYCIFLKNCRGRTPPRCNFRTRIGWAILALWLGSIGLRLRAKLIHPWITPNLKFVFICHRDWL